MLSVLVINGGRGAASIIPNLLEHEDLLITSVVNAYDDGKSTGEIRKFFNMLGPSDIRKVQELMLPKSSKIYQDNLNLFKYRFPNQHKREDALKSIEDFVKGKNDKLVKISFSSDKIKNTVRIFFKKFFKLLVLY